MFLLVGESTSVTRLPSAKTAYPVTGACLWAIPCPVEGIQVTSIVPSCGPPSTLTSIGGSGNAKIGKDIYFSRKVVETHIVLKKYNENVFR